MRELLVSCTFCPQVFLLSLLNFERRKMLYSSGRGCRGPSSGQAINKTLLLSVNAAL